jgi:hypothetical protein
MTNKKIYLHVPTNIIENAPQFVYRNVKAILIQLYNSRYTYGEESYSIKLVK